MDLHVAGPQGFMGFTRANEPPAEEHSTMSTNHSPTDSAAETYARRHGDIARLLDVLTMELDAHRDRAALAPGNWRHAGDLAHLRSGLIDLITTMTGKQEELIEDFLDDAHETDRHKTPPPPMRCICPACNRDIEIRPLPLT